MTGVSRSLFVPLSLAVGFAMIASFLLSSSLVPVLSVWLLRQGRRTRGATRARERLGRAAARIGSGACCIGWRRRAGCSSRRTSSSPSASSSAVGLTLGREIFPPSGVKAVPAAVPRAGRHEVRVDRAAGARRARRDQARRPARTTSTSRSATSASSPRRIRSTRSSCGPADRTKACCRWRSSPRRGIRLDATSRRRCAGASANVSRRAVLVRARRHRQPDHELRRADAGRSRRDGPGLRREPGVRGEGAGRARADSDRCAICSSARRSTIRRFRSTSNRQMAGQLGVTVDQVGRSFAAATSSSRFVAPNYWADPRTGIAFQVQVEVPQPRMTTLEDLRVVPVSGDRGSHAAARRRGARSRTPRSSANTTASTDSGWSR